MSQQTQSQYGMESQFEQQPMMGGTQQVGQQPGIGGQQGTMAGSQGTQLGSQGYAEGGQTGIGGTAMQGGQAGGGIQQAGGTDLKLDEALTDQMRVALHDFVQAANVCEWCAERCVDHGPEMSECLRLCRDVADLASLNVKLLARDSVFGPETAEVFIAAANACAQECAQHPQRHCQECAEVLPRAVRTVQQMLASFGGGQGGLQQGMGQGIGAQSQMGGGQPQMGGGQPQTGGMQSQMGQGTQFGQQY